VQNNLAQVYLLLNQYEPCLDAVQHVFNHEPNNIKALFRQAKALFELGRYDQAVSPLKFLLQSPNGETDKEKVKEMLTICQSKLAKYQQNEKEIYRRMFQPVSTPTTTVTSATPATDKVQASMQKTVSVE
jgi:tetratricopeptide (TPR) repeat protein